MRVSQSIKNFFRLPTTYSIHHQVRVNFRRNFIVNTLDASLWLMGDSFLSVNTILPVFASTLTDSPILIGLVPALIHAGWLIPQLFLAGHVKRLTKKLPFTLKMGIIERIPFVVLPLAAYLLHWISKETALWVFMLIILWRGIAGGMVALPWQELIATIIPSPVRSRFFGVSRTIGRICGVIGSIIAGWILAELSYPNNFAVVFLIGAVFIGFSFVFLSMTVEPEPRKVPEHNLTDETPKAPFIDIDAFKKILNNDSNFRRYLTSRSLFQMGNMAIGFFAVFGIQRFSLADEHAAVFTGLIFISSILGFFVWGVIGDWVGPRKILIISDLLQVFVLILAFLAPGLWAIYAVFVIFGFVQTGHIIGEMILGMELGSEEDRPVYMGLSRSIPGVFILIAPLIGGAIVGWLGYQNMFLIALIFVLGGIILLTGVHNSVVQH